MSDTATPSGGSSGSAGFTVQARLASGEKVPVQVADPESTTVDELRTLVAAALPTPADPATLRLVLRGRILKGDEALISSFGVANGDIIHVARPAGAATATGAAGSASASSPAAAGAGSSANTSPTSGITGAALAAGLGPQAANTGPFGPEMSAILDNPFVQSLLESPELMQAMLRADPRLRALAEENPEINRMLSDPSTLREMSRLMRNPRLMQEMLRNQDRALSNIEAIPGGFNQLSSIFSRMQGTLSRTETADPSTGKCPSATSIPSDATSWR
ncbi:hypothetical protein HK105_204202 [Polyrhizophydium stewartii]|uniref:Ubiquitin-like domain-containing protein n=1 Tax=Polyrhizophydium stewartii TaxID=2732419 RepID=A0ABR4N9I7_9FUNG